MRIVRSTFTLGIALLATACSEQATVLGPQAAAEDPAIASGFAAHGPGHRVVGSGHVEMAAGLREFTFHAIEHPGEGVSGSYKVVLPNGLFFEADVTCMAVDGATGWVAGIIRDSNAAVVEIGSGSMFYAIDNGEGAASEADVVSIAAFNQGEGADLEFCDERPLELGPLSVTGGNVQVR